MGNMSEASSSTLILLGLLVPVSAAGVSQTQAIAWICFAIFILFFIACSLYVRHRRAQRSLRGSGTGEAPVAVSAWAKAAPPKDNGRASYGQSAPAGEWERDA